MPKQDSNVAYFTSMYLYDPTKEKWKRLRQRGKSIWEAYTHCVVVLRMSL